MKITTLPKFEYNPGQLGYFQFIRGGIGADYHQEPRFYQYPDGDVLMYWAAYDFEECSPNGIKLYSITKDGGISWSSPEVFMADYLGGVPYFISMLRLKNSYDTIMMFTHTRHRIEVDEETRMLTKGANYFEASTRFFIRWSNDGGRTFSHGVELPYKQICADKELPKVGIYGAIDHLMQLESGRIVAAFNFLDPQMSNIAKGIQHFTLVCLYSDDGGQTWHRSNEIISHTPRGAMECQIAETEPNRLLCLFRTAAGCIYQSLSTDGGKTWGPSEPTSLPSPESMVRMLKLKSGNLLVVWNNVSSTTQNPRHPLSACLSADGGRTWGKPKMIADETGLNQLSNHGMIQLPDGRILLAISHYRAVRPMTSDLDLAIFDEIWLSGGDELPLVWKFRIDPKNIGQQEKWYLAKPDSKWSDIRIDRPWTEQGYEYHGAAWYSVEFECPKLSTGKSVKLRFGAVDGVCWIWLDGQLVGQQLEDPAKMWNKPFMVDITGKVQEGKKHRLVVKVVKESFAAGIWKPVDIVQMTE